MKTIRGRTTIFRFPQEGAASLDANEDKKAETVGFRLVNDGEFRRYTGSGHLHGSEFVRSSYAGSAIHPLTKSGGMGFRLAHGGEEE